VRAVFDVAAAPLICGDVGKELWQGAAAKQQLRRNFVHNRNSVCTNVQPTNVTVETCCPQLARHEATQACERLKNAANAVHAACRNAPQFKKRSRTMSAKLFRNVLFACPLLALGCTESTTSKDVTEARENVVEEQQDVDEARHEAMKPEIDQDAAEDIQEEQQDVAEAQEELKQTEQEFAATQARDQFALEAQNVLNEANRQLEALETRHDSEQGAAADATQQQIDDLKTRRDRLDQAIDDMKGEDLLKWSDHRSNVQTAMNEVQAKLTETR
jgi:hypothetical protein